MLKLSIRDRRALVSEAELAAAIQARGGRAPDLIAPVGPCVAINSGPKVVGMAYRSKQYARG